MGNERPSRCNATIHFVQSEVMPWTISPLSPGFVVSHEVNSETHRNGHQTYATLGLMAGFGLMIALDTALG